jgi:glycine betaine/choline ABC-type transport system substrate-binding protein
MVGGRYRREILEASTALLAAGTLGGCQSVTNGETRTTAPPTVAVASKNFAENRILSYMTFELLQAKTDLNVVDAGQYGGSEEIWADLRNGDVHTYWEYTGTQYIVLDPPHETAIDGPQALYEAVEEDASEQGVAVYERASFDNTFVLVVQPSWQEETGVQTLSELAAYINDGNTDMSVALGEDFATRTDGWPGLLDHYGVEDEHADALEVDQVPLGVPYDLLANDRVTVGMGFDTDPHILRQSLAVLSDDEDYFPTYNPAPVAHAETSERTGLGQYLDRLGPALGGVETIRRLNGRAVLDDEEPRAIARSFLEQEGLIQADD